MLLQQFKDFYQRNRQKRSRCSIINGINIFFFSNIESRIISMIHIQALHRNRITCLLSHNHIRKTSFSTIKGKLEKYLTKIEVISNDKIWCSDTR